jgi:hypothetical protein
MPTYDPALYQNQLSELPAEVEVATATISFLRELRPILASLGTLQTTWHANNIPALVEAAALAGEPLAGHPAVSWQAWGTVFTELQVWLSTPIASIGKTPLQVLMTRYVAQEVAA